MDKKEIKTEIGMRADRLQEINRELMEKILHQYGAVNKETKIAMKRSQKVEKDLYEIRCQLNAMLEKVL